jgi:hypothetical protein
VAVSLLGFHLMASERGDGLHPQLRALLESRRQIETDARIVDLAESRAEMTIQAGPNPITPGDNFRPGNVVNFGDIERKAAFDARSMNSMKGRI